MRIIFGVSFLIVLAIFIFFYIKEVRKWKYYIRNVDDFRFTDKHRGVLKFVNSEGVIAYVWANGHCSIHLPNLECILCDFDLIYSKKMALSLCYNFINKNNK